MVKRYKYVAPYLSRDLTYQKIHPLRGATVGAECVTPFRKFENRNVRSKKWILVML